MEFSEEMDFEGLIKSLEHQAKRCEELNTLKSAIRQLNDSTRIDLSTNMQQFVDLLTQKLDEFSELLKEHLKLHHKLVNEKQAIINAKSSKAIEEIKHKVVELKCSQPVNHQQRLNELYQWGLNQRDEIEQEFKNYSMDDFWPKINYTLPSAELSEAIKELKINIGEESCISESTIEQRFLNFPKVDVNEAIDCGINTGLDDSGRFWLTMHTPAIIDEINNYIRYKRITDPTWKSYSESKTQPEVDENCFFFEKKPQKWSRGKILAYKMETKTCKVHFLDKFGICENVSIDSMIPWKSSCLDNVDFQTLKCCLFLLQDEQKIVQDTKYVFRDMTRSKQFKCIFKEKLDDVWLVDLYDLSEYSSVIENNENKPQPVNKYVVDDYKENLGGVKKAITCADIRLEGEKDPAIQMNCTVFSYAEAAVPPAQCDENISQLIKSLDLSSLNVNDDDERVVAEILSEMISKLEATESTPPKIDDDDQESMTRSPTAPDILYLSDSDEKEIDGECFLSEIAENGIFWISPKVSRQLVYKYEKMSEKIEKFILDTKQKTFRDLNVSPAVNQLCFVGLFKKDKSDKREYKRGLIESIDLKYKKAMVRLLDRSSVSETSFHNIYPYTEFDEIKGMKFKSIRCSLVKDNDIKLYEDARKMFEKYRMSHNARFMLMEKIVINKVQCWHAAIRMDDGVILNETVLKLNDQLQSSHEQSSNKTDEEQVKQKEKYGRHRKNKKKQDVDFNNNESEAKAKQREWPLKEHKIIKKGFQPKQDQHPDQRLLVREDDAIISVSRGFKNRSRHDQQQQKPRCDNDNWRREERANPFPVHAATKNRHESFGSSGAEYDNPNLNATLARMKQRPLHPQQQKQPPFLGSPRPDVSYMNDRNLHFSGSEFEYERLPPSKQQATYMSHATSLLPSPLVPYDGYYRETRMHPIEKHEYIARDPLPPPQRQQQQYAEIRRHLNSSYQPDAYDFRPREHHDSTQRLHYDDSRQTGHYRQLEQRSTHDDYYNQRSPMNYQYQPDRRSRTTQRTNAEQHALVQHDHHSLQRHPSLDDHHQQQHQRAATHKKQFETRYVHKSKDRNFKNN